MEFREYQQKSREMFETTRQESPIIKLLESKSDSVEKRKQEFIQTFRKHHPELYMK